MRPPPTTKAAATSPSPKKGSPVEAEVAPAMADVLERAAGVTTAKVGSLVMLKSRVWAGTKVLGYVAPPEVRVDAEVIDGEVIEQLTAGNDPVTFEPFW